MNHIYRHRLKSGNEVMVTITLPLPSEYFITWSGRATSADVAEYRRHLRPAIIADLTALDGKPHVMRDELEPCQLQGGA